MAIAVLITPLIYLGHGLIEKFLGKETAQSMSEEAANNFMHDHRGEKIILFKDITPHLVMGLDGIEYP